MKQWKIVPLAALLMGSAAAVAAQPETSRVAAAPPSPRGEGGAKVDKPLVMLVCEEVRAERRARSGARLATLSCRTRWAGL
jgi:hypothetical protein